MQKNLLETLAIDAETTSVIAVVGGGGKTSLIFRLMEEFVAGGKKVIVTTTTHMAYEPDRPFAEDGDTDKICDQLKNFGYTVAAGLNRSKGKIDCLPEEKLSEIKRLCDVLLIEADGAKRLPAQGTGRVGTGDPGVCGSGHRSRWYGCTRRADPEDLPQAGESRSFPQKRNGRDSCRR